MKRISELLPALGYFAVDFHRESADVLECMGDKELERLRKVPHLGVASTVFTGINHSRLEYTMLQCAVTSLIAKLHRSQEHLALASSVKLDGLSQELSSGEELLKCWSLLSNYGHTQYTYGVERSLLQYAQMDKSFLLWLTNSSSLRGLNTWSKRIIQSYDDGHMHHLIALKRIALQKEWRGYRKRCCQYIRNLVLPIDQLHPTDSSSQYKLFRLRELFKRVRLICIVALDSHYSHQPISLQLNSTILSFSDLTAIPGVKSGFDSTLNEMAAWLADELYLHPKSVAVQRAYEIKSASKIDTQFKTSISNNNHQEFINNIINQGLGKPDIGKYAHLIRLSFPPTRSFKFDTEPLSIFLQRLQNEIVRMPATAVSVDKNRHSSILHVDLLYNIERAKIGDLTSAICKSSIWVLRAMEAESLNSIRKMLPVGMQDREISIKRLLAHRIKQDIRMSRKLFQSMFECVINMLLPIDYRFSISGFFPTELRDSPLLYKVALENTDDVDGIIPTLQKELNHNPRNHNRDRLTELKMILQVVKQLSSELIIVCCEPIKIYNPYGKMVDEWDGTIIEIKQSELRLTVLEAKSGKGSSTREQAAYKQLLATKDILRSRYQISYRRHRMKGIGAYIRFSLRNVTL